MNYPGEEKLPENTTRVNGKELFRVQDTTFSDAGKIGLWTKADAVTFFDDYKIKIKN